MAQARLWLWGLVPLAAFWLLGARLETRIVETDLAAAARDAAGSQGLKITARGRDIVVDGLAKPDEAMAEKLEQIPGVRQVLFKAPRKRAATASLAK